MQRITFSTAFGRCAIKWHEAGLIGFELPEAVVNERDIADAPAEIAAVIARVRKHLGGDLQDFSDLNFDFRAEPAFQIAVLRATLAVKAGCTRGYGEIAKATGHDAAASRAVGAALGANRWPLLIPCHGVGAANGKMTGFSGPGGIKTKLRLLALEGAQLFAE
jgi:methylated-DNA-[protein]-cysteine S-methyltransferase